MLKVIVGYVVTSVLNFFYGLFIKYMEFQDRKEKAKIEKERLLKQLAEAKTEEERKKAHEAILNS